MIRCNNPDYSKHISLNTTLLRKEKKNTNNIMNFKSDSCEDRRHYENKNRDASPISKTTLWFFHGIPLDVLKGVRYSTRTTN